MKNEKLRLKNGNRLLRWYKNLAGVAVSVTPRQIINQSLSHFFHNEKSIVLCAFRYYNIPARKKVHVRRKKNIGDSQNGRSWLPTRLTARGRPRGPCGFRWHQHPRISSTAISPGILSRMPFVSTQARRRACAEQ